ncbi:MAG TPA: hypothetical protein VFE72_04815 [Lysobacter sp.]|nr:hypothetical protein [Lysobacter sp.]
MPSTHPSARRILFVVATLSLIGVGTLLAYRPGRPVASSALTPWVPLPSSGTDASLPEVRAALFALPDGGDGASVSSNTPLAATCGIDAVLPAAPHYRAIIDAGLVPQRLRREIDIVVHGQWADVRIRDVDTPPPPPGATEWMAQAIDIRLPTTLLDGLRQAWDSDAWRGPQSATLCTDAARARLEACVDGRYAVRRISCELQSHVAPLLRAVRALPAPPRGTWQ